MRVIIAMQWGRKGEKRSNRERRIRKEREIRGQAGSDRRRRDGQSTLRDKIDR